MTWLSHMRRPRALWRDLGSWRFFGIQMLLFGTLVHFLLAPILWTFWLVLAGIDLPWMQLLPERTLSNILMSLAFLEIVSLGITLLALRAKHHRWLRPWALSLPLYFPFATIAAWKAAIEMLRAPFYWDKTSHGRYDQPQPLNR